MSYKEGYLKTKVLSHGVYRPFELRWVALESSALICYKSKNKDDITHNINMNHIIDVIPSNDEIGQFELIRNEVMGNITFTANTEHHMKQWICAIKNVINNTKQPSKKRTVHKTPKFRPPRSVTAPLKKEENGTLKKQNKLLKRTVNKLRQTIKKLTQELLILRRFKAQSLDKYKPYILINSPITNDTEQEKMKRRKKRAKSKTKPSTNDGIDHMHNIDNIRNISRLLKRRSTKQKRKLLGSPSKSATPSPASSDNEFENDALSLSGNAMDVSNALKDDIDDILSRLKSVNKAKSIKLLMNEDILFESKMKVYSTSNDGYVETAGILTKNNLYLLSAMNYSIWIEFRNRTKIDDIINDENDNGMKIDTKKAQKMMKNLDIIDDYKINSSIEQSFIGKTKREIKLKILLHETPLKSLSNLFVALNEICCNETRRFEQVKDVHCVIIKGFYDTNIIPKHQRDSFIETVFDGIPWMEQQKMNDSIVITLARYCSHGIISLINDRKNALLSIFDDKRLKIDVFDETMKYTQYDTSVADIKTFDALYVLGNVRDKGFGFVLKSRKNKDHDIICLLESNNVCHEWMTHLDYAMFDRSKISKDVTTPDTSAHKDKLMNDFTDDDVHFGFGVYLNYWQNGFDNTVHPKYDTLKQELLNNEIANISEKDYYEVYEFCSNLLKTKRHTIRAKDIGINNKQFNIKKGEGITINHFISLKVYTDFARISCLFKRAMRKRNVDDTMNDLIERNAEIALWSRYIKESCTFYGRNLAPNRVLYTGLKRKLLFSSMKQHFECPLSTTLCCNKALGFCEDDGIILKLKAGNSKTKYFDVSILSQFQEENERLIMGSSLKICDIYICSKSSKHCIAAFLMFEQLMNGQFVDSNMEKEEQLYVLLAHIMNMNTSHTTSVPSTYTLDLLQNMIKEMKQKYERKELWINQDAINKLKYIPLSQLFKERFFSFFKMEKSQINWVQQYSWNICDDVFNTFKWMAPRKYILSETYECEYKSKKITFYLKCCSKYSEESLKCALFLYIDKLPKNMKGIKIEYDLLCKRQDKLYRNVILPQWLSSDKLYCGLQAFSSKCLNKLTSISWKIGLKVIDVTYR